MKGTASVINKSRRGTWLANPVTRKIISTKFTYLLIQNLDLDWSTQKPMFRSKSYKAVLCRPKLKIILIIIP